jgi:hypothetical protein
VRHVVTQDHGPSSVNADWSSICHKALSYRVDLQSFDCLVTDQSRMWMCGVWPSPPSDHPRRMLPDVTFAVSTSLTSQIELSTACEDYILRRRRQISPIRYLQMTSHRPIHDTPCILLAHPSAQANHTIQFQLYQLQASKYHIFRHKSQSVQIRSMYQLHKASHEE